MAEQTTENIEQKFIPDTKPIDSTNQLSHLFVYQKEDGGVGALAYTPETDANGQPIPLTQESFYQRLAEHDTMLYNNMADSVGVPKNILAGAINYKQDRSTYLAPIKPDIEARFKDLAKSNPIVAKEAGSDEPSIDTAPSYAPAVQSLHLASILDSQGFTDYDNLSDRDLRNLATQLIKESEGKNPTEEELNTFVQEVRNYKPTMRYKKSAYVPMSEFKSSSVNNYNALLRISDKQGAYDNWFQHRGVVKDFWDPENMKSYSAMQKAVEFFRDPVEHFNTELHEDEEKKFQKWFSEMKDNGSILQGDVGYDYDFRGAFKDDYKPVKQADGTYHWTDKYKKPNHETFSKESKYANGIWKKYAGEWKDGVFDKPTIDYPRAEQQAYVEYQQELALTTTTEQEKETNPLAAAYKNARRALLYRGGTVTGFASDMEEAEGSTDATSEYGSDPALKATIKISKYKIPTPWLTQFGGYFGQLFKGANGWVTWDGLQHKALDIKQDIIANSVNLPYTDTSAQANQSREFNKFVLGTMNTSVDSDVILKDILPTGSIVSTENSQIRRKDLAGAILYQNIQNQQLYITNIFASEYPELVRLQQSCDDATVTAKQYFGGNKEEIADYLAPYAQARTRKTIDIVSQRAQGVDARVLTNNQVRTINSALHNPAGEASTYVDSEVLRRINLSIGNNPELAYIAGRQLRLDPQYQFDKEHGQLKNVGKTKGIAINDPEYLKASALALYYVLPSYQSTISALANGIGERELLSYKATDINTARFYALERIRTKLGDKVGMPGQQQEYTNEHILNALAYIFTYIAAATFPGEKPDINKLKRTIDSIVDEYAGNFITSKKYKTSITKGAAQDAGIHNEQELSQYIYMSKNIYKRGIEEGIIGSEKITSQLFLQRNADKVEIVFAGGNVYGYVKDSEGYSHILQVRIKGEAIVDNSGSIVGYNATYGGPFNVELPSMVQGYKKSIEKYSQLVYKDYPKLGNYLSSVPTYDGSSAIPGVHNTKAIAAESMPMTADNIVQLSERMFLDDPTGAKNNIDRIAEMYIDMHQGVKKRLISRGRLREGVTDADIDNTIALEVHDAIAATGNIQMGGAIQGNVQSSSAIIMLSSTQNISSKSLLADDIYNRVDHKVERPWYSRVGEAMGVVAEKAEPAVGAVGKFIGKQSAEEATFNKTETEKENTKRQKTFDKQYKQFKEGTK